MATPIKNIHSNYHYCEVTINPPSGTCSGVCTGEGTMGILFKTAPEIGGVSGEWISNKHVVSFGGKYYKDSEGSVCIRD